MHSIDNIELITDQKVLEDMLYKAADYDDRKKIRAHMRSLRQKDRGISPSRHEKDMKKIAEQASALSSSNQIKAKENGDVPTEVSLDNIDEIEDERVLEGMLYQTKDYDARKKIRAAMRILRQKQREKSVKQSAQHWKDRASSSPNTDESSVKSLSSRIEAIKKSPSISSKTESSRVPSSTTESAAPTSFNRLKSLSAKYSQATEETTRRSLPPPSTKAPPKIGSIFDREDDHSPKKSRNDKEKQIERRRREITRNRSMPASTSSAEARKMFQSKLENNLNERRPRQTVKLGRTASSIVPNANNVKAMLLRWCQAKTRSYENVNVQNFSSSWSDGMAFCALVNHFFPDAFDYNTLDPANRKINFETAFNSAEKHGDIVPLLDVEDMVNTYEPDWKCVYTYLVEFYKRIRDLDLN